MSSDLYKTRILIIEDENFMRLALLHALNGLGFASIFEAASAEDAISFFRKRRVDLIITDIEMGKIDGLTLARMIRAGETAAARDSRVVVLTGLNALSVLSKAGDLDIHGFLAKPVSAVQLKEMLKNALSRSINLKPAEDYQKKASEDGKNKQPKKGEAGDDQCQHEDSAKNDTSMIKIRSLKEGMVLGENITARGGVLLTAGTRLNKTHLRALFDFRGMLDKMEVEIYAAAD